MQQQYDSKVIKALYKKDKELHKQILTELKPDFEKLKADKQVVFDDIERLRKKGLYPKSKKKIRK